MDFLIMEADTMNSDESEGTPTHSTPAPGKIYLTSDKN